MKNRIKWLLQKSLGFSRYLYLFARIMVLKLPFDRKEKDFLGLRFFVGEGDHVLDIGANIGVMTVHMARWVKTGKVFSFEPVPENYAIIQKLVKHYHLHNVRLFPFALGNRNGEAKMVMPEMSNVRFHGLSHLVREDEDAGKFYLVPMKKLDDVSEIQQLAVKAIKIDVENAELEVLKGAEKLLESQKPVVYCELWDNKIREETLGFMKTKGYRCFYFQRDNFKEYHPDCIKQNFFFVHNELNVPKN